MRNYKKAVKKGFTLVELVVVIAIVAILGAVSVVGYFAFIDKAKVSNDVGLVNQLNLALQANEAEDGSKNRTYYDAIQDIKENGIDMETLKLSQDGVDILWNQNTDRFVLANETEVTYPETEEPIVLDSKLWKIYDSMPEEAKYSVYLTEKATTAEITTAVGLDTGKNESITKVTYTGNVADTILRTNSTTTDIVINNADAELRIYGTAKNIEIQKAKLSSVHAYGKVLGKVDLTLGSFVAEAGSNINTIEVNATATAPNIKLKVLTGSKVGTIISRTASVNVTTNNDNINIPSSIPTFDHKEGVLFVSSLKDEGMQPTDFEAIFNKVNNSENGGTITFLEDTDIQARKRLASLFGYQVKNNVTLNFNGHAVNIIYDARGTTSGGFFTYSSDTKANLTFENGKITSSKQLFVFSAGNISFKNVEYTYTEGDKAGMVQGTSHIYFDKDSLLIAKEVEWAAGFGFKPKDGKSPTGDIYGSFDCDYFCLFTNGTDKELNFRINVYETANFKARDVAIYCAAPGTFNMYGGSIVAGTCFGIKTGNVNILGGTLHANEVASVTEGQVPDGFGNGINTNGSALHIESNSSYAGTMNINIKDCTLISDSAYGICEILNENVNGETKVVSLQISNVDIQSKLSNIRCSTPLAQIIKTDGNHTINL